ncbi:MAG: ATP synthase F1 subunit gamma [Syntrophomonadaceae bacterium]|jgi:F-type H+-transporting ATPase subunit gamma|nr:ATP synthase F1 subunit gamma [Syntrophomonadaceae bacterium]MDH7497517.1 ATP synthase F1 subunit gamma [Syntrophomonadaceae bacterium]
MAGKGVREYKRRIRSVSNTRQITKAMKMVSAAKLRKAQESAEASRPYAGKLAEVLSRLAAISTDARHPLLEKRESIEKVTYLVVTADRGLCGAFNTNIIRLAAESIRADERPAEKGVAAVGRKSRDFFRKRGYKMQGEFVNLGDNISYAHAKEIGQYIIQMYEEAATDEVYLVYARFVNALRQVPTIVKLLPLEPPKVEETGESVREFFADYIYEPSADAILTSLLPRYVESQIYHALLESKASEHGARMTAMSNATDNASELVDTLTLSMNKARQAAITSEILEIVGGAEALKKGGK